MKTSISLTLLLLGLGLLIGSNLFLDAPAQAADGRPNCSVRALAGRWIFATEVGQIMTTVTGDITAIGTMNFDRKGNLRGKFDNNIYGFGAFEDIGYFGTVEVDRDCTGTLVFETTTGSTRVDSIAVVSKNEMWGMSTDKDNLWTYRMRRISGRSRGNSSDDDSSD